MKRWTKDIAAALLLGGVVGSAAQQTAPPGTSIVSTPEAIRASDKLWQAIAYSSTWDYSKLFDGEVLSVGVRINPHILHSALSGQLKMHDVAEGFKAMTGHELGGIDIDKRTPSVNDLQAVATQVEAYFKQFRNIGPVVKKAATFQTLKEGEKIPRLLMSIPRQPLIANCKGSIDRLYHWCALKQTIESLGGKVIQLDPERPGLVPVPGFFDQQIFERTSALEIFTRDPVLVMHDRKMALVPDFVALAKEERPIQVDLNVTPIADELYKQGYITQSYKGYVQGGDFIYDPERQLIMVGLDMAGFDVNQYFTPQDAVAMQQSTGCTVLRVKRTKHDLYHLDTAIAPLPDGKYLINPAVTDAKIYKRMQKIIGKKNIIEIPREEERYVANLIAIGHTLIMPACSAELEKRLEKQGFSAVTPEKIGLPAGAWDIQKGSVHCMTQQVMRPLKHIDDEACASALSDPAQGQSVHTQINNQDIPFHRREQLKRDIAQGREPRSKV